MTDWLYDTLLATSALILLVLAVRGPVARHFGPSVAYWLWLLPAMRAFMPSLTKEVVVPAQFDTSVVPFEAAVQSTSIAATQPVVDAASIDWISLGLSAWLGGAALLFIVQMVRYIGLRDEMLADAVEIDRIGDIRIIQTDRIGGPLAFGLFRRYVAVPDHFTRTFNVQERQLALAHELAHHRAGDLYVNLAAFIFLCLQWFNPLAWLAWSAFRFDQEAACDARVLAGTDISTRQHYGRALARSATDPQSVLGPALAMAMASSRPRSIIERLRRVMMEDTSKGRRMTGKLAIFAAAAIALPLTATVVPVFAEEAAVAEAPVKKIKKHKIVMFKGDDGKLKTIDISGDAETPFVKKIEKDGRTIVLRSNKELTEAEIEKLVAEAEESRVKAEALAKEADAAQQEAESAREKAAIAAADVHRYALDAATVAIMLSNNEKVAHLELLAGEKGYPITEETYREVRAMADRWADEKALLKTTLQAMTAARQSIALSPMHGQELSREVLEALDREISHLKIKIRRTPDEKQDETEGGDA